MLGEECLAGSGLVGFLFLELDIGMAARLASLITSYSSRYVSLGIMVFTCSAVDMRVAGTQIESLTS